MRSLIWLRTARTCRSGRPLGSGRPQFSMPLSSMAGQAPESTAQPMVMTCRALRTMASVSNVGHLDERPSPIRMPPAAIRSDSQIFLAVEDEVTPR
jgi:hypothetical protein